MPIIHDFKYFLPADRAALHGLLAQLGGGARILAGGTDLVPEMKSGSRTPEAVIDIKAVGDFRHLTFDGRTLSVGALVTMNEIVRSPVVRRHFPLLCEASLKVGSHGLRNRATLVGNLCSAVPCLDGGPPLQVYGADIRVSGPRGSRTIPISQWFAGARKTTLAADEVAEAVVVEKPAAHHASCYVKLGRYRGEDLAQASVAVLASADGVTRVAFGAVADRPVRAVTVEALLAGSDLADDLVGQARALAGRDVSPITDIRATREYRLHMCGVMLERALQAVRARLAGGGPALGAPLLG